METSNVEAFFYELKPIYDCTEQLQKDNSTKYEFEFNPLIEYFDTGDNELSLMLYFFLDPWGKHGQRDFFLKSFVELD